MSLFFIKSGHLSKSLNLFFNFFKSEKKSKNFFKGEELLFSSPIVLKNNNILEKIGKLFLRYRVPAKIIMRRKGKKVLKFCTFISYHRQ